MVKYRTKGFVFKKVDKSEADRSFSVFTEDYGRLEILGRATRKINSKLRSGIDVFYFSEIEFIQGKNNKTLTDAIKINNNVKNLRSLEVAGKITNVLDNFLRGQEKDEAILNLLNEIFSKLNDCLPPTTNCSLIYYYFLWNFLSILGYHPEVQKCAECSSNLQPENLYFSNKDGGVICEKCLINNDGVKKINADFIKIIRLILKKDWQTLSKLKINEESKKTIEVISEEYLCYIMPNR